MRIAAIEGSRDDGGHPAARRVRIDVDRRREGSGRTVLRTWLWIGERPLELRPTEVQSRMARVGDGIDLFPCPEPDIADMEIVRVWIDRESERIP